MDDKDDPYDRLYQARPALPPFSSLRPCLSVPDGVYQPHTPESGYGIFSPPYQHHQNLYSPVQSSTSHLHHHSSASDFHSSSGSFERGVNPQVSSSQPSSSYDSSAQGSYCQTRDQPQCLDNLQQPPIPHMSLSLQQSSMLGSSHLSPGIQNVLSANFFSSGTENPAQIPLGQIGLVRIEGKQNSYLDVTAMPQTIEGNSLNTLKSSLPAQSADHLQPFNNFTPFYSKNSGCVTDTKDTLLPDRSDGLNCYDKTPGIPEFSGIFTSVPGYVSSAENNASHYGVSRGYSLSEPGHISSSDDRYADSTRLQDIYGVHNQVLHMPHRYNSAISTHEQYNSIVKTPQKAYSFSLDQTTTMAEHKGRKKKKMSEKIGLDIEGKTVVKKKRSRVKKPETCPEQELSVLPCANSEDDSVSAAFCLSPTFIASLSSKRAQDPYLLSDNSYTKPHFMQNSDSFQGAVSNSEQHFPVTASSTHYFNASNVFQHSVTVPSVSSGMHSSSVSSKADSAQSLFKKNSTGNKHESQPVIAITSQTIHSKSKVSEDVFNEPVKVETRVEEESSCSPFQLSPGFIASLSSKRAEEHATHDSSVSSSVSYHMQGTMNNGFSMDGWRRQYQSPKQSEQTYMSNLGNNVVHTGTQNGHASSLPLTSYARQSSFLKSCVSPPTAYYEGSEFQYPTPPMEDDEGRMQSPGHSQSPAFLESMHEKIASYDLSQRLSPDSNISVLPTPPNSAGPKLSTMPDIPLSKEDQKSRILEIIAREREKMSFTSQTSDLESKRKKKKKKCMEMGVSVDNSNIVHVPQQMNQHAMPLSHEMAVSNRLTGQSFHPNHTNPRNPETKESPSALPAYTNSSEQFSNGTVNQYDETLRSEHNQHQQMWPENDSKMFDSKQNQNAMWRNSGCATVKDAYNNQMLQNVVRNLHEDGKFKGLSPEAKVLTSSKKQIFRSTIGGNSQHHGVENNHSTLEPLNTPGLKVLAKDVDPYAFDDSEQGDTHISLVRGCVKPVSHLLDNDYSKAQQVRSVSHVPFTTRANSAVVTVSEVPFSAQLNPLAQTSHLPFNHANSKVSYSNHRHMTHSQQDPKSGSSCKVSLDSIHTQENTQVAGPSRMCSNNEQSFSKSHSYQFNYNIKEHSENQHRLDSQNNPLDNNIKENYGNEQKLSSLSNASHFSVTQNHHKMHEYDSPQNSGSLSASSQNDIARQKFINEPSIGCMKDYYKSFPDPLLDSRISDVSMSEERDSKVLGVAKKKRGRPPKTECSVTFSSNKPKLPKLTLHEKKLTVKTNKKIIYKLNGAEVKSSDLNINQNLVDRLANNLMEVADCSCLGPNHIPSESTEGPYYTQLGAAKDIPQVRKILEKRTGVSGSAIRIEKVIYTGKEGKSKEGCPIAKWIIRRSGPDEKYLCIVRKRPGHFCDTAVIIMVIVAWEGVDCQQADTLYDFLINTLPQNGLETDRRCGLNEKKTCACQGVDLLRRGASFSFGCSWSMYYNGCKFARSQTARKFKLKKTDCEEMLEEQLEKLAMDVAPLYSQLAPDAFRNQTQFENQAADCRLGKKPGRPFSGVTAVVDFCCHSHRDCHNMNNGSTVVVNLTKHRGFEKPDDEQYHVLPLYILDQTDELGSKEGQMAKISSGSLEVLSRYMTEVRTRSVPYRPCKRNRTTPKKQGLNKKLSYSRLMKRKSLSVNNCANETSSEVNNRCLNEDKLLLPQHPSVNKKSVSSHPLDLVPGVGLDERHQECMTYTDLMSHQGKPGFSDLYTKFWDYFYIHGEFPQHEWTSEKKFTSKAVRSSSTPDICMQSSAADHISQQQHQPWQLQDKQRLQQHNDVAREDSTKQLEKQRQQISANTFIRNQGLHSSSPSLNLPFPPMSPRQQNQYTETSNLETPHASLQSSLHTLPVTHYTMPEAQKGQHCITTSVSASSTSLQQPFEHPPISVQSNISYTAIHQSLDCRNIELQSSANLVGETDVSGNYVHPISQKSSLCKQSSTRDVSVKGSTEQDIKTTRPSPHYHLSAHQHNMQSSLTEASYSLTSQGKPPSYVESLAQSHNFTNADKLNISQNHIYVSDMSLHCSMDKQGFVSQSHSLCPSGQDVGEIQEPYSLHQIDRSAHLQGDQRPPFSFQPLERSQSAQSRLEPVSDISVTGSFSPQSSQAQGLSLQRPPSAQLSPRPLSAQSRCASSELHSTAVQFSSGSGRTQSTEKPSLTTGQHLNDNTKVTCFSPPASSRLSENCSLRLSSELLGENHSPHLKVSHARQRVPTTFLEISQAPKNLSIKPQHYCQTDAQNDGFPMGKVCVNNINFDSLKKVSNCINSPESSLSSSFPYDQQIEARRKRSWSRMSEPFKEPETVRPSSCSSEPDLLNSLRATQSHNLVQSGNFSGRHSFKTQACSWQTSEQYIDNSRIVKSKLSDKTQHCEQEDRKHLVKHDSSTISNEPHGFMPGLTDDRVGCDIGRSLVQVAVNENSQTSSGSVSADGFEITHSQNFLEDKNRVPLLTCSSKSLEYNHVEGSPGITSTLSSQNVTGNLQNEDICRRLSVENVCPNGPYIGEKIKVHKSEGFVVPKLGHGPSEPPYEVIDSTVINVETDDNREVFEDPAMGGVAIALCHGAVLFEVAKRELHATTALKEPNRYQPKRISLVFYQHKNLNLSKHGYDEYERKIEERKSQAEQARLIEEMESKGFFKGELSELASFPNLTKGTFGKVFNFPESKKSLFPLLFPRYLDSSHSEHITPVMFACMSIAFPNYMKEAFPDPSKLPGLVSGHLTTRMHSSLSDKRKNLQPAVESELDAVCIGKGGKTIQKVFSPWNINLYPTDTLTTHSVITRWVHEDVSVTGPYNRWVELPLHDVIKKEIANTKEEVTDSFSQLDQTVYVSGSQIPTSTSESNAMTGQEAEHDSVMTKMIKLEQTLKTGIDQKQTSIDNLQEYLQKASVIKMVDSSKESSGAVKNADVPSSYNDYANEENIRGAMDQLYENSANIFQLKRSENFKQTNVKLEPGVNVSFRNGKIVSDQENNQQINRLPVYNILNGNKSAGIELPDNIADPTFRNYPIRKLAAEEESDSTFEDATNTHKQTDLENQCAKNADQTGSKQPGSVYDFLMKSYHQTFLLNQQNNTQGTQDGFSSCSQGECL